MCVKNGTCTFNNSSQSVIFLLQLPVSVLQVSNVVNGLLKYSTLLHLNVSEEKRVRSGTCEHCHVVTFLSFLKCLETMSRNNPIRSLILVRYFFSMRLWLFFLPSGSNWSEKWSWEYKSWQASVLSSLLGDKGQSPTPGENPPYWPPLTALAPGGDPLRIPTHITYMLTSVSIVCVIHYSPLQSGDLVSTWFSRDEVGEIRGDELVPFKLVAMCIWFFKISVCSKVW